MPAGNWGVNKLGRLPRRVDSKKKLMLANYLDPAVLPLPPVAWDGYLGGAASPIMGGNNKFGNCTIVGVANQLRMQAAIAGIPLPDFTDEELIAFYFARTGGPDTGLNETDVLDYVVSNGFPADGRNKFAGTASIEINDWNTLALGAYLFGGVYLGIELPISAQSEGQHWSVQGDGATGDDAPGSWGGHCVILSGVDDTRSKYDKPGNPVGNVSILSWAEEIFLTKHWLSVYGSEAHVLLDAAVLTRPGVDGQALLADMRQIGR